MRPVLHIDLTDAARALLGMPQPLRQRACTRMIEEAEWADVFARRTGQDHPLWGNGTLSDAARKRVLAREPTLDDTEYCTCLELVLHGLTARHRSSRMRN